MVYLGTNLGKVVNKIQFSTEKEFLLESNKIVDQKN